MKACGLIKKVLARHLPILYAGPMTETQIGSKAVAEAFARGSVPAGSRKLGQGCYRTAYLHPDGFVYKVSRGNIGQSLREPQSAKTYSATLALLKAQGQFTDWEVANCTLYMCGEGESIPVVVMEHHEGEHENAPDHCGRYWEWNPSKGEYAHQNEVREGRTVCEACTNHMDWGDVVRAAAEFANAIEYYDMHPGNYVKRHSDGVKVLIDCG